MEKEFEGTNDFCFFIFWPLTSLVLAYVEERDLGSVKAGDRDRLNGEKLGIAPKKSPPVISHNP